LVSVEANEGTPYVIVAEKSKQLADPIMDLREIGSSSPSPFVSFTRQEYNRELQGLQGLQKYDRMRKSDGTVRGSLRLVKTPVLAAHWFVEPASDSVRDKNAAEFVWKCLTDYMSIGWAQVLSESLLSCDFGYYMFEKVWEERVIEGKPRMVWKKLAPRHPMDVKKWDMDAHGGPNGVVMYPTDISAGFQDDIPIPIDKLLVFTFDREAGDMTGISVLRSAYKHWYFKDQLYKIDAIQKERHGIGIPVIKLPMGFTDQDKREADNLGRNLRTNERAHVVLPPNWELLFAKLEGHFVDAMVSIEHHNAAIRENVLGGFIAADVTSKEEDQTIFLKATRFVADMVCDTFNKYAIEQLVEYNFSKVGVPKLRARRIGEQADWRTMSFSIRNLIGANVLTPDDQLEEHLREEMDLPIRDIATSRATAKPQAGNSQQQPGAAGAKGTPGQQNQNTNKNQPGMPRQGPPSSGPGNANAGKDGGGK
jgi:hypothetical protein